MWESQAGTNAVTRFRKSKNKLKGETFARLAVLSDHVIGELTAPSSAREAVVERKERLAALLRVALGCGAQGVTAAAAASTESSVELSSSHA